jgi:hypothetical protein
MDIVFFFFLFNQLKKLIPSIYNISIELGNPRGNENPWLLSMGVLWFREHNYQADRLKKAHPDWHDEKLFFEARKWTIAMHQRTVVREWLPAFLGLPANNTLPQYSGYDPSVDPQISHIFQSAAMRWGVCKYRIFFQLFFFFPSVCVFRKC